MKRIAGILFSSSLMAIVFIVFAVSIAFATIIENDFGSASARTLVYNARWFEVLLLLGALNLAGRIFIKKLYQPAKFSIFIFHVSFIIILSGAALTRYTGSEGTVSIREGKSTNQMLSDKSFITITNPDNPTQAQSFAVAFSPVGSNRFHKKIHWNGKNIDMSVISFIPNAVETIIPDPEGAPIAEIIYADSAAKQNMIISSGEVKRLGQLVFVFDASGTDTSTDIILTHTGDSLFFKAPWPVTVSNMSGTSFAILDENKTHPLMMQQLYTFNGQMLALNQYYVNGSLTARSISKDQGETYDAISMLLKSEGVSQRVILQGSAGYPGREKLIPINGTNILLSYGSVYYTLPFNLKLNDFLVERYPGSQSPSSFESRVTLIDESRSLRSDQRIFMNNILKYRGYRFFQSSFDADEKGTLLSVNHDQAGTLVTYAGYLIMAIGMILSIFNPKSRFRTLYYKSRRFQHSQTRAFLLLIILFIPFAVFGGDLTAKNVITPVDAGHAALFGKMLIQDNSGRIKPVNTLTSEVLRKLIRKNNYKGMNPDQVFLGMFTDPEKWQNEPIIRSGNERIQDLLNVHNKYLPFSAFFKGNRYVLENYAELAYRKKPVLRTKFDNEIIKVDERVNIAYLVFSGEFLKLFPVPGDSSLRWYSHLQIRGLIHSRDSIFTENVLYLYVQDVQKSLTSGDWTRPDELLNSISSFQKKYTPTIIPDARKIKAEIFLNHSDIFSGIAKYYGMIGILLLIIQFLSIFSTRKRSKAPVWVAGVLILLIFLIHTAGLGMRWYVSGHAPWSNGFEALIYVAWATVLAGLLFASRSSITLSVTSILAFLILTIAHLSWMDPQITNLVPVLKSYWLVIHVATITASYGFLSMGAILAFINLLVMICLTEKNKGAIRDSIAEISNTIEMSLTVGLYLLTMGVFLGAVWANESWGRYWGWDPKETWALVTVLVYAFVLHMRMIPGLGGIYAFNLAALTAISSVIMTYFGVNYYLSGLHSYAKGDAVPIPSFVYYSLVVIFITAVMAYFRYRKYNCSVETIKTNDSE